MKQWAKVILNPFGGRWTKKEKLARVEKALRSAQIDFDLQMTEAPGHGVELAAQAAQEAWPVVVAAGGDGTINEVVNGLMRHEAETVGPLGILPTGTANDLATMLDLPLNIQAAAHRLAANQTRLIDVGQVNGRYFVNNSAIGLEPVVTLIHEEMRWLKGNVRYIAAAIKGIIRANFWQMTLRWDGGGYDGPVILVSVGNSRRTGGAFYMTPNAEPDDGLLDFIYGGRMSRWRLLTLLPRTFTGSHIHQKGVTYARTTTLSITCSPPTPIQADGEVFDEEATEINYQIFPDKLRVLV